MVASVTSTTSTSAASTGTLASSLGSTSAADQSTNFLKLLVAQLNNQDPMNPMDNAQMTSQIAQINTVSGIQQLNTTMTSMAAQYTSMQVMQGAAMIGKNVMASGNTMSINNGVGTGAVNLAAAASNVQVQVKAPSGQVLSQINLGAMAAGNQSFQWYASSYTGGGTPTFSVSATEGSQSITATPLIYDKVSSVGTDATGAMNLKLQSGSTIAYSAIKSLL